MVGIPSLKTILKEKPDSLIGQLFRYAVVGGISFVVDYGSLWLLTEKAGLPYLWSAAIAFILGLICNYLLSTAWVFGESKLKNAWAEFAAFAIIGVIGLGLNALLMLLFRVLFGEDRILLTVFGFELKTVHLNKAIATLLVMVWNYFTKRAILQSSAMQRLAERFRRKA